MDERNTHRVDVAYPSGAERLTLKIGVGACRLKIAPGSDRFVSGTYTDPTGALPLKLASEDGAVRITQGYSLSAALRFAGVPTFDLALGTGKPFTCTLESGASELSLDLGGLPITELTLRQGAGKLTCDFSRPSAETMSLLRVDAGAVALELRNLANAGLAEMIVDGGAASYDLDFGGSLRRDARARITAGASAVLIRIPSSTAAKVAPECEIGSLEIGDGLTKKAGMFWTEAAVAGKTPVLTVDARVTLGSLRLQVTP